MNRLEILFAVVVLLFILLTGSTYFFGSSSLKIAPLAAPSPTPTPIQNPLAISVMREKQYPGSDIVIEETLSDGPNYHQYIASYKSDGLKIYGLLTVPRGEKPKTGWPVIIFNHGYIPPAQYQTTERYGAYVAAFASKGYVVFKPDYRGHGESEGQPEGAYYSPSYATDVLNATSSIKKYKDVDPSRIGMWGHSMGGNITLRNIVVHPQEIKAAVIWGGVVGTYDDILNNWRRTRPFVLSPEESMVRSRRRSEIVQKYKTPKENPVFWNAVDPNSHVEDVVTPVQIHSGKNDEEVPWEFSQGLYDRLKKAGKTVELYLYDGADHNISSPNFEVAMQRSIEFFDTYLKGGEK